MNKRYALLLIPVVTALFASPSVMADGKVKFYTSNKPLTAVPASSVTTFKAGEPIYGLMKFNEPPLSPSVCCVTYSMKIPDIDGDYGGFETPIPSQDAVVFPFALLAPGKSDLQKKSNEFMLDKLSKMSPGLHKIILDYWGDDITITVDTTGGVKKWESFEEHADITKVMMPSPAVKDPSLIAKLQRPAEEFLQKKPLKIVITQNWNLVGTPTLPQYRYLEGDVAAKDPESGKCLVYRGVIFRQDFSGGGWSSLTATANQSIEEIACGNIH